MAKTQKQKIDHAVSLIYGLARLISTETVADIWVEYAGHVDTLFIHGYTDGYEKGKEMDYNLEDIQLDKPDSLTRLMKSKDRLIDLYRKFTEPSKEAVNQ